MSSPAVHRRDPVRGFVPQKKLLHSAAFSLLPCLLLKRVTGADDESIRKYITERLRASRNFFVRRRAEENTPRIFAYFSAVSRKSKYVQLLERMLPFLLESQSETRGWIFAESGRESDLARALDSREECRRLFQVAKAQESGSRVQRCTRLQQQRAAHVLRGVLLSGQIDESSLLELELGLLRASGTLFGNITERRRSARELHRSFWNGGSVHAGAVNDLVRLRFGIPPLPRHSLSNSGPPEVIKEPAWPLRSDEWYTGYTQGLDTLRQLALGPDAPLYYLAADLSIAQTSTNFKASVARVTGWAYYFSKYFNIEEWARASQVAWRISAASAITRHAECVVISEMEARLLEDEPAHLENELGAQMRTVDSMRAAFLSAVDRLSLDSSPGRSISRTMTAPDTGVPVDLSLGFRNLPLDALTVGATAFADSLTKRLPRENAAEAGEAWVLFGASAQARAVQLLLEFDPSTKDGHEGEDLMARLNESWPSNLRLQFPEYYNLSFVHAASSGLALLEGARSVSNTVEAQNHAWLYSLVNLACTAMTKKQEYRALRALKVWVASLQHTIQYCKESGDTTRFMRGFIKTFGVFLNRCEESIKLCSTFLNALLGVVNNTHIVSDRALSQVNASILQACAQA